MSASLADLFAHGLGLLPLPGHAVVTLRTTAGRAVAGELMEQSVDKYVYLEEDSLEAAMVVITDFAARFLPAFMNLFLDGSFGEGESPLLHQARKLLVNLGAAPPFGRILREQPETYKRVFLSQVACLDPDYGWWSPKLLYSPTNHQGDLCARYLRWLCLFVDQMMAFAGFHGHSVHFLREDNLHLGRQADKLYALLDGYRPRPPGFERGVGFESSRFPETIKHLDGIRRYLSTGTAASRFQIPPAYKYWVRCEAMDLPGAGPCVKPETGAELSCCGRCKAVRYCSQPHQKKHWKTHKAVCFTPTW